MITERMRNFPKNYGTNAKINRYLRCILGKCCLRGPYHAECTNCGFYSLCVDRAGKELSNDVKNALVGLLHPLENILEKCPFKRTLSDRVGVGGLK